MINFQVGGQVAEEVGLLTGKAAHVLFFVGTQDGPVGRCNGATGTIEIAEYDRGPRYGDLKILKDWAGSFVCCTA